MPVPDRNAAFTSGATVTSTRYYPKPGHTQVTVSIKAFTGNITWTPYMIDEGTQARVALTTARAVTAGSADGATFLGTFSAIEIDVANTNATAGTYTWSIQEGGC